MLNIIFIMKKAKVLIVYAHPFYIENQTQNRDKLPLGPLYALAAAKRANPQAVKFVDMTLVDPYYNFREEIALFQPDIVAIGIHSAAVFPLTCELAKEIKTENHRCIVVVGGLFASGQTEECLKEWNIDYVLKGEVDESLTQFIQCFQAEKTFNVPGLFARKPEGNGILEIAPVTFPDLNNLSRIPEPGYDISAYTLWDPYLKGKALNISSMRGCPYNCAYCCYRIIGSKKRRVRDGALLINDLKTLTQEYQIIRYNFVDDNFLCSLPRAKEVCNGIKDDGLIWRCQCRIDSFKPDSLADYAGMMSESGCHLISFGIESGDEELLKKINKPTDLSWARKVCAELKKYGIKVRIYLIVGLPYQTVESIELSKQFLRDIEPDYVSIETFVPHKGSIIGDDPEKWGVYWETDVLEEKIQRLDWLNNEANKLLRPCIHTKWMDSETIKLKREELLQEWPLPV